MTSTDALIPLMRTGLYALGKERSNYDADIWEGKLDPAVTPWKVADSPYKREYHSLEEFVEDLKREMSRE